MSSGLFYYFLGESGFKKKKNTLKEKGIMCQSPRDKSIENLPRSDSCCTSTQEFWLNMVEKCYGYGISSNMVE